MALNAEQIQLLGTLQRNKNMYYRLALSFTGNEADALDAISPVSYTHLDVYKRQHFTWGFRLFRG